MDGHCYQCAEKFGFFRKEHGCKKCGHSFCKTCLPYKAVIPGRGASTEEQPVCKECFTVLNASPEELKQNQQNEGKYSPPENYKKRVAAYNAKKETQENKGTTSKVSSSSSAGPDAKRYKGLSEADRNLAQRLDRLKEDRKKMRGRVASVEEMEDRLRQLKGFPQAGASSSTQQPTVYQPPDSRTSYQQSDDLITEMKEEAAIDARVAGQDLEEECKDVQMPSEPELQNLEDEAKRLVQEAKGALKQEEEGAKKDEDMAARVAKLKGISPSATDTGTKDEEEISEEEATKRLITQLMEETKLEDKVKEDGFGETSKPTPDSAENKPKVDPDELPWCCICNEDATLRCHGCDEDIYCARCFRDGHDQFDLPNHKTVPYKPPKNQNR